MYSVPAKRLVRITEFDSKVYLGTTTLNSEVASTKYLVAPVAVGYARAISVDKVLVGVILVGGDGRVCALIQLDTVDVPVLLIANILIVYQLPELSPLICTGLVLEVSEMLTETLDDEIYCSVNCILVKFEPLHQLRALLS